MRGPSSTTPPAAAKLAGWVDRLSDTKPSDRSCLRIESSSESSGAEVSTLKQYSSVSFLGRKKCNIGLLSVEKSLGLVGPVDDLSFFEINMAMDDQV